MVWRHWWRHQHENTFSWIISIRSFHIQYQIEATFENFKILKFSKVTKFLGPGELFVGSVTGNGVCYIDSQFYYLHFEFLIDAVAQILTELW